MDAPVPANERARLDALRALRILDTDSEKAFDDLCSLAAQICDTPISFISFLDTDRQWFKSKVGLTPTETSRNIAFCAFTILQSDMLIVPDASSDKRFANNPLVTSEPKIRFYAGAPLVTSDGFPVGTLCVLDRVARSLTSDQQEALRILRDQVVRLLELRRHQAELKNAIESQKRIQRQLHETESRFFQFLDALPVGVFVIDPDGTPFYCNQVAKNILGRGIAPGAKVDDLADTYKAFVAGTPSEYPMERMPLVRALAGERTMITDLEIHRENRIIPVQVWGAPIYGEEGRVAFAIVAFCDISDRRKAEQRFNALYAAARLLAETTSLSEASHKIIQAVCEAMHWDVGAIWEIDDTENVLYCVNQWHSPEVSIPEFQALTMQLRMPRGMGLIGRVWANGKPVWVKDVVEDTNFPRLPAALKNNLHSAFAFPILVGNDVSAVMEFFSREIQEPDEELLAMFGSMGIQIGQFLVRKRIEKRQTELLQELSRFSSTNP